ncbi:MAG: DUF2461 domain-containing protein [Pseudomonadota bacterium]
MEKDGFTQLIDDSNVFFKELAQNNSKEWFNPRKDHYNENIKKPAEFLGDVLAEDFARLSGMTWKPKLFRIYRDVRFSKDKTPLNAHLHLLWSQPGDNPLAPAFFFGTEPGHLTIGFGIMGMKGEALTAFRRFIDRHGDTLVAQMDAAGMTWSAWGPDPLKRVPAPYDADHSHSDLLKKKGMILNVEMDESWRSAPGGLVAAIRDRFERTLPLQKLMQEGLR